MVIFHFLHIKFIFIKLQFSLIQKTPETSYNTKNSKPKSSKLKKSCARTILTHPLNHPNSPMMASYGRHKKPLSTVNNNIVIIFPPGTPSFKYQFKTCPIINF